MKKIVIAGAGLSGLIAGSMLRGQVDTIIEKQSEVPNNHSALLRFKTGVVGDATGIPFKKVRVMKDVMDSKGCLRDSIDYSIKVTGTPGIRSIVTAECAVEERYIAPTNFISMLAEQMGPRFWFDADLNHEFINKHKDYAIISTLPMPMLMDILGYERPVDFNYKNGWTITCSLGSVDFCGTYYYPDRSKPQYRASVTGNKLIVEGLGSANFADINARSIVGDVAEDFGMYEYFQPSTIETKAQQYAKALPIDDGQRKRFIMWASDNFGIYSLGRFATWRPNLLLDDLVNDVRVIQRIINGDSSAPYNSRKD